MAKGRQFILGIRKDGVRNENLNYPAGVKDIEVQPAGSLEVIENAPTDNCLKAYALQGKAWGRSRLAVTYEDETVQTIHYTITKPAAEAVKDMGSFLTTRAWFDDPYDPFGRSPSVMTYDREEGKILEQWHQAWVVGLGDDGGATWLAGAMKPLGVWMTLEAGRFEQVELDTKTQRVRAALAPADAYTPVARLHIEQPAQSQTTGSYAVTGSFSQERDAYVVPLGSDLTWVELSD